MASVGMSWVLPGNRKTWKNLQLCQVDNPSKLWVREGPSECPSEERLAFLHLEKQMNTHFRKTGLPHPLLSLTPRPRDVVAVSFHGRWYRGRVKAAFEGKGDKETILEVFLLDYGINVEVNNGKVVGLGVGEWSSVAYQAKRIALFALKPVTLLYTIMPTNIKLEPRETLQWDTSADEFVKKICHLRPPAEFHPIALGKDGCLQGFLSINLSKNNLNSMPELSPKENKESTDDTLVLDLAGLLVHFGYGAWDEEAMGKLLKRAEEEEKEAGQMNGGKKTKKTKEKGLGLAEMLRKMKERQGMLKDDMRGSRRKNRTDLNASENWTCDEDEKSLSGDSSRSDNLNTRQIFSSDTESEYSHEGKFSRLPPLSPDQYKVPSQMRNAHRKLELNSSTDMESERDQRTELVDYFALPPDHHSTPLPSLPSLPSVPSSLPSLDSDHSNSESGGSPNSSIMGVSTRPNYGSYYEKNVRADFNSFNEETNAVFEKSTKVTYSDLDISVSEIPMPVLKSYAKEAGFTAKRTENMISMVTTLHSKTKTKKKSLNIANDRRATGDENYTEEDKNMKAQSNGKDIKKKCIESQNAKMMEGRAATGDENLTENMKTTLAQKMKDIKSSQLEKIKRTELQNQVSDGQEDRTSRGENKTSESSPKLQGKLSDSSKILNSQGGTSHQKLSKASIEFQDSPFSSLTSSARSPAFRKFNLIPSVQEYQRIIQSKVDFSENMEDDSFSDVELLKERGILISRQVERADTEEEINKENRNRKAPSTPPPWLSKTLLHTVQKSSKATEPKPSTQRIETDKNRKQKSGGRGKIEALNKSLNKSMKSLAEKKEGYKYKRQDMLSSIDDETQDLEKLNKVDGAGQALNMSFMSDTRDVWTHNEVESTNMGDFEEGEFAPLMNLQQEAPNIARLYRVFVGGMTQVAEDEVMVNEIITGAQLNPHIVQALSDEDMRATRLQAYTWPVIARGSSAVIVGGHSCGKTLGYVVPLLSTLLDTWQHTSKRLVPGVGAALVIVCGSWRGAKSVADYMVNLLPSNITLRIMTAWGGCGREEMEDTRKLLLGGCDILITTAPCLVRLLTGEEPKITKEPQEAPTPVTSLSRCCHLVIDDADLTLELFPNEIKKILIAWGEGRSKGKRGDVEQQVVVVGAHWTPLLDSLTHTLLPLMDPAIIISAPLEAAIATKLATHAHFASSELDSLTSVVGLIKSCYVDKKNLIFVSNRAVSENLMALLENAAVYSLSISSSTIRWKLQHIVKEWHMMRGVTLVICKGSEHHLLRHDLANADTIFQCYISQPVTSFALKYGFLIDNLSRDLNQNSLDCESHIMISPDIIQDANIMERLQRLCTSLPQEITELAESVDQRESCKHKALCYYLKAYGICPVKLDCRFRHHIQTSDIPTGLPRSGEVTLEVVRVLNASRFLVRLIEFREKAGAPSINMKDNYQTMFSALQDYYANPAKCKPLRNPEQGMYCAVEENGQWARGQVVKVSYAHRTPLLVIFLVDEGREITVAQKLVYALPPSLAAVPELIVEVYLCRVKPLDQDREWTYQASQFIHDVFTANGNSTFVGRITLALGLTLWLSPVVEFTKVGKTFVQKEALRSRLITQGFGVDNPSHLENLKELCTQASVPLHPESLSEQNWKTEIDVALAKLRNSEEENLSNSSINSSNSTLKNNETCIEKQISKTEREIETEGNNTEIDTEIDRETEREIHNSNKIVGNAETVKKMADREAYRTQDLAKSVTNIEIDRETERDIGNSNKTVGDAETVKKRTDRVTFDGTQDLTKNMSNLGIVWEELPLLEDVRVMLGEVESVEKFFIIREDKLESLESLETEIATLNEFLHSKEVVASNPATSHLFKDLISPGSVSLTRFTDDNYYRGLVLEDQGETNKRQVLFIDHGETTTVSAKQVHACPQSLLNQLPGQAIQCSLAHITVPHNQHEEAAKLMNALADNVVTWNLKALEVRESCNGRNIYIVELTTDSNPPKHMWKQLVDAGVALPIVQEESHSNNPPSTPDPLDSSFIEGKEAADFIMNFPELRAQIEKVRKLQQQQEQGDKIDDYKSGKKIASSLSDLNTKSIITSVSRSGTSDTDSDRSKTTHGKPVKKVCRFPTPRPKLKDSLDSDKNSNSSSSDPSQKGSFENENLKAKYKNPKLISQPDSQNTLSQTSKQNGNKVVFPQTSDAKTSRPNQNGNKNLELVSHQTSNKKPRSSELSTSSPWFQNACLVVPQLEAVEGITPKLNPETSWSQTSKDVIVTLHLVGVEKYKCRIGPSRLTFMTMLGDKFYVFDEALGGSVDVDHCVAVVRGTCVSITLRKITTEQWKSLVHGGGRRAWLRGEVLTVSSRDNTIDTEHEVTWQHDEDRDKGVMGGLPAGISDTDASSECTDDEDIIS